MKQLIFLLSVFPIFVSADPSTATRYLINEPASLMDVGLMRLNFDLQNALGGVEEAMVAEDPAFKYKRANLSVTYDLDNDKIIVSVIVGTNGQVSGDACRAATNWLRNHLNVVLPLAISHIGYKSGDQPKNLYEGLIARTEVQCWIVETPTYKSLLLTHGSLNGTDIFVAKPD